MSIVTAVAPMALFVLLALFASLFYRRIAGKLIEKFRPHQQQWILSLIHILCSCSSSKMISPMFCSGEKIALRVPITISASPFWIIRHCSRPVDPMVKKKTFQALFGEHTYSNQKLQ